MGVIFAIPDEGASLFWFPVGLISGFVISYGRKMLAHVFFASLLFYASIYFDSLKSINVNLLTVLGLPIFTVFQAYIVLIASEYFFPSGLKVYSSKEIRKYLITVPVAGTLCTLFIIPIISIFGNLVESHELEHRLPLWLIGDYFAIAFMVPIVMSFSISAELWKIRRTTFAAPILVIIFSVLSAEKFVADQVSENEMQAFNNQSHGVVKTLEESFNALLFKLNSVEAFYLASTYVDASEFKTFSETLIANSPGLQAIEWVPVIEKNALSSFEEKIRNQGFPRFFIFEKTKNGKNVKVSSRSFYYPVYFVEPYEPNIAAHGFDLGSSPERREAIQLATKTRKNVMSRKISLVQEKTPTAAVLVFRPIFSSHLDKNPKGFALGVFKIESVINHILKEFDNTDLIMNIKITDITNPKLHEPLTQDNSKRNVTNVADKIYTTNIKLANRTWEVSAIHKHLKEHSPFKGIKGILTITYILFLLFFLAIFLISSGRQIEIRNLVEERTHDLLNSQQKAEQLAKTKTEFLANMSHEIRTPMNGLLGILDILNDTKLTTEQKSLTKKLSESGEFLVNIINDILDFSKLESGAVEIEIREVDLKKTVIDITSQFHDLANKKGIELNVEFSDEFPATIDSDEFRIKQILFNLIGNAMKFTSKGSVDIKVNEEKISPQVFSKSMKSDNVTPSDLSLYGFYKSTITVKDTGLGIPTNKLEDLFNVFSQVDNSTTRKYGGSGLGLSIVKKLVTLLGGSISVESKVGVGSIFSVILFHKSRIHAKDASLDKNKSKESIPTEQLLEKYESLRVLVAEDNKTNQFVIEKYFKKVGINITLAGDGVEAVSLANQNTYDLIFMDLHMPNMDGTEATNRIKSNSLNSDTPIIALTADVLMEGSDDFTKLGFSYYLSKPLKFAELVECIKAMTS
jgi:signal transduction histidine kinase/CheY-like chemotaxis protein